ncbi:MAG: hypothetical protein CSA25_04180 [Desulfobacter postgatei]|uniref:Methyltransferase type 11 n=1 Tax=Desulfobacter postgatei TaxID=2293 RepID=A0A2G6MRT8_9BACT|nr:MAG: hypothetical protein CSA25_04180 [Desulfobacter postgatei]
MLDEKSYSTPRTKCPVCACSQSVVLTEQKFADLDNTNLTRYDVSLCRNCGMLFANNIPSQKDFDEYYFNLNRYENEEMLSNGASHSGLLQYISDKDSKRLIGDFGCGSGIDLLALHNWGYKNLIGVDTSRQNCNYLKKKGITTVNKSVFRLEQDDFNDKFDAIFLMAVLEHIVDLHGFIKKTISFLDGDLVVCVPEQFMWRGDVYPYREYSIEHINYFTFSSLCRLMDLYDYEPHNIYPNETGSRNIVFCRKIQIEQYNLKSNNAVECALNKIDYLLTRQRPVIVYGCGTLTRYMLANTRFSKLNIIAFADGSPHYHGKQLCGIPIIDPIELTKYPQFPILTSTYVANRTIETYLHDVLHIPNEVISLL